MGTIRVDGFFDRSGNEHRANPLVVDRIGCIGLVTEQASATDDERPVTHGTFRKHRTSGLVDDE